MPHGLKSKLILAMLTIGALPLLLAMLIAYGQGNKSLQGLIGSNFKALAHEASTKLDLVLTREITRHSRLIKHPAVALALKERGAESQSIAPAELPAALARARQRWEQHDSAFISAVTESPAAVELRRFLQNDVLPAAATRALYLTGPHGELAAAAEHAPGYPLPDTLARPAAAGEDTGRISDIQLEPGGTDYIFQISLPLVDGGGAFLGALHRVYRVKDFFAPFVESTVFGDTGHVMLINSRGVVIDCPILPTGFQLSDAAITGSVTVPAGDWALTQGDGHGSQKLSIIGFSPLASANKFIRPASGQSWHTFAWQASDELFTPTRKLFLWISCAGIFSLLLIVVSGSIAAEAIVKPIKEVQNAAARIGRGESVAPLVIRTGDEIELLAHEVNSMNAMLRQAFSGLEDQVRLKTREVLYLKDYTESILMSVPEVILIFGQDLAIEYVNDAFCRLTGLEAGAVLGKRLRDLDAVCAEPWRLLDEELAECACGAAVTASRQVGGQAIRCYTARDPLEPPAAAAPEARQAIAFGERVFSYQFFHVAIKVETSRRTGLLLKEVTEERKLADQLAMAEKLSGMGTLTAGIAHEMNNPLYAIMGYTEAIQGERDVEKIHGYAGKVLNGARHMASVILNFSGYSRANAKDEWRAVDINERLDAAIEIARIASYSDSIVLEKNYGVLPPLKAKPEEIQQIFVNVIKNAVQAMAGKGRLYAASRQSGGFIEVTVRDTGPGIPAEHIGRIFDPFFTTKRQGEGTGLGLNIVHRLVKKYGGGIRVESRPGQGASFIITFHLP